MCPYLTGAGLDPAEDGSSIEAAVPVLHTILKRAERGEDDYLNVGAILQARDEVLGEYQ